MALTLLNITSYIKPPRNVKVQTHLFSQNVSSGSERERESENFESKLVGRVQLKPGVITIN